MQVLFNQDEGLDSVPNSGILRPPDEKELNRIKPNPTLKMQPIFIDPGPMKKADRGKASNKTLGSGLCLEITGRVQHDDNELKHLMTENQQAESVVSGNEKSWRGPSVSRGLIPEDEAERYLECH